MYETLDRVLTRAVDHLIDTQDESGAWITPPDPRILETGLATYALAVTDATEPAVVAGRTWLALNSVSLQRDPLALMIENAIRDIVLDKRVELNLDRPELQNPVLRWRTAMLQALVLHAGQWDAIWSGDADERLAQLRAELADRYDSARRDRLRKWTVIEVAAARLLVEHHVGNAEAVRDSVTTIKAVQSPDGSIAAMPVSTAMAALALGVGEPEGEALQRARAFLIAQQHDNGGWGLIPCHGWDTVVTIWALRDHPVFREKCLPRAVAWVQTQQRDDGGFTYSPTLEPDLDTTSAALSALEGLVEPERIERALGLYRALQRPDGLWNTYYYAKDVPADDCVARVVGALNRYQASGAPSTAAATRWLAERFSRGEEFLCGYRNRPHTVETVGAAIGFDHHAVQAAAREVAAAQNDDGGWGQRADEPSCASATGAALSCLVHTGLIEEDALSRALSYLERTQRADGSWAGPPELLGPRPLLSHVPAESHAVVVTGLMAVAQRRSPCLCGCSVAEHSAAVDGIHLVRNQR